ncbi:MAG: hypothetical protein MHPSP_003480, partial [Paramarteilia canceri]
MAECAKLFSSGGNYSSGEVDILLTKLHQTELEVQEVEKKLFSLIQDLEVEKTKSIHLESEESKN